MGPEAPASDSSMDGPDGKDRKAGKQSCGSLRPVAQSPRSFVRKPGRPLHLPRRRHVDSDKPSGPPVAALLAEAGARTAPSHLHRDLPQQRPGTSTFYGEQWMPESANFFCKEPNSTQFRFCGSLGSVTQLGSALWHPGTDRQCAWLCATNTSWP